MLLIAWLYPHFPHTGSMLAYLVASPMGLIPSPRAGGSRAEPASTWVRATAAAVELS